jgi:hypothetical protein
MNCKIFTHFSTSFEIFFICLREKVIMQQNIGTFEQILTLYQLIARIVWNS